MGSLHGLSRGTALEPLVKNLMTAEANGTMMYYALARLAEVCPVCGYEYVGDISQEPDDYVCPLCGQPKSVFKQK